jgi:hypothetical protein
MMQKFQGDGSEIALILTGLGLRPAAAPRIISPSQFLESNYLHAGCRRSLCNPRGISYSTRGDSAEAPRLAGSLCTGGRAGDLGSSRPHLAFLKLPIRHFNATALLWMLIRCLQRGRRSSPTISMSVTFKHNPSMTLWETDYCIGLIAVNEAATCMGYAHGARSPVCRDT